MKKHLFKRQFSKKNAFLYKIFCASILGSSLLVQDQLATAGPKPDRQEERYKEVENDPFISNQPIGKIQAYVSKSTLPDKFTNVNFKDKVHKRPNGGQGGGGGSNDKGPTQDFRKRDNTNTEQKNSIPNIISLSSNEIYVNKDHQSSTHLKEMEKHLQSKRSKNKIEYKSDIEAPTSPTNNPFGWSEILCYSPKSTRSPTYHFTKLEQQEQPQPKVGSGLLDNPSGFESHELTNTSTKEQNSESTKPLNKGKKNPQISSKAPNTPSSMSPLSSGNTREDLLKRQSLNDKTNNKKTIESYSYDPDYSEIVSILEHNNTSPQSQTNTPAAKPSPPAGSNVESNTKMDQLTNQLAAAAQVQAPAAAIKGAASAKDNQPLVEQYNQFSKGPWCSDSSTIDTPSSKDDLLLSDGFTQTQNHHAATYPPPAAGQQKGPAAYIQDPAETDLYSVPLSTLSRMVTEENRQYDELNPISSDAMTRSHSQVCGSNNDKKSPSDQEIQKGLWTSPKLQAYQQNEKVLETNDNELDPLFYELDSHTNTPKDLWSSLKNNLKPYDDQAVSQDGEADDIEGKDQQNAQTVKKSEQDIPQSNPEETVLNKDQDIRSTSGKIPTQTKVQNYANRVNLVHFQLHALQAIAHHMETWSSHAFTSSNSVLPAAGEYDEESLPLLTGLMKKGTFVPWISGHYGKSIQGKVKNHAAYRADLGGFSIGTDFVLNECTVLGISYTKITSKLKYRQDRLGDKESTDSQTFTLYGQYNFSETLFAQSALAYTKGLTKHSLKNQESYKSSSKGFAGFVSLNNVFVISNSTFIVPRIGLRYIQNKEKDVQVGDVKITGSKNRYLTAILGSKILFRKNFGEVSITPGLYAGLEQPIIVKNQGAKASIIEAGKTFEYQCPASKNKNLSYNLGAEISAKRKNIVLSLSYQCSLAKKYVSHQGSLKIGIAF
ncbi:hypothetical protein phytr_2280 [Candidatus Phycorickettsia trachydisci]|uniref:Autotransporter domain-containing protein n=1 Tax=Candidatus Phycorickettsia trachydisci TaxID=2115978 RepID=A0A2P1P7F2_9RICK|nr:autotransporter outer membrane beta-barrel domain-containing protein [Candidatus Phycorickettsia trachydisci]AVP87186.1 hypothetical protein phytr_2280 [Candidatus Phycorickettsia trachydisci]